jgi:hypothetical protein
MAINPELITTIRVDQLPDGTLNLTNKIPHTSGTVLEKASVQDLVDLVATAIGVSGGVGYLALSVTDGQQLPDVPELPSFFLCGAGTFLNINGYPNIICTENLNDIMSLTDHWELAVEIPINPLSGTVQSVTGSAVDNTDPLNPIVNLGGSAGTLAEVLLEGNITDGTDISISDGDKILLDNGANLKKGTTDAGLGGTKGIALRCAVDYELKWEAGRLYVMEQDGFTIREVSHNFTNVPTTTDDETKGFIVDSHWILDNGDVYKCNDATTDNAVWELINTGTIPTLQQVTNSGRITADTIIFTGSGSYYKTEINTNGVLSQNIITGVYVSLNSEGSLDLGNANGNESSLKNTNVTNDEVILEFPDKPNGSYTIATTDDILDSGVTSVGLTMPSAFAVTNSPITSTGDIAVTGAGLVSQYVRGDGTLANFTASTGGGASLSFYLNGSVSQGTFGGIAFKEMDRTPILGAGTDFTINANGYIQSFITDANVPNQLEIPAGNWNFETYFSASSSGGTPTFYVELYKWNGTTLSLIASNSANPESITNGTAIDLYVSALAIPQTTLLATDRLAVRIYVNHSGRTITLHTEDNHLCQVITTFSTGITALNGLTAQVQNLAVGTSGTDFAISSTSATHTFNLPTASATNRGALSSTDWSIFNNKQNALGFTAENVANKQTDLTASATKYPTVNAVNNGLDLKVDKVTGSRLITSAESTILGNTSGTNTGDQNLSTLAPIESPTFTGTVVLPSTTSIGNVSSTEIGYVDGVTSAIQTQINSKITQNSWVDYSATSTIVGWSSFTTKIIRYYVVGKIVTVLYQLAGNSNSTTTTFTLPFTNANNNVFYANAFTNNSISGAAAGRSRVLLGDNFVTMSIDFANTAFLATGTKTCSGTIIYEIS